MTDNAVIPDFMYSGKGTILGRPSDIRPGQKPLVVEIPEDETQEKPSVTITLPDDPKSGHLPFVKMISFSGDYEDIELQIVGENRKTGVVEPFKTVVKNSRKPIRLTKLRAADGESAPINVESITVTVLSGQKGKILSIEMKMVACIGFTGETSTTSQQ
jgi:hypothetical protein